MSKIEKFSSCTPVVISGLAGHVMLVASQTQRDLADIMLSFEGRGEELSGWILGSYATHLERVTRELDDALGNNDEALLAWLKRVVRRGDPAAQAKADGYEACEWLGWLQPGGEFATRAEVGAKEDLAHREAASKLADQLVRLKRGNFEAVASYIQGLH